MFSVKIFYYTLNADLNKTIFNLDSCYGYQILIKCFPSVANCKRSKFDCIYICRP